MQKHKFNKMPEMREADYNALLENMREFGYDDNYPIVFYENDILDGWNRYRACTELELEYSEHYFVGTYEEAVEYVHRSNTRRNLTPNEQSELIGRYYEDIKIARGGDRKSEEAQKSTGTKYPIDIDKENDVEILTHPTRKKVADTYGVSESKVKKDARYVRALDTVPEEIQIQARAGEISKTEVINIAEGKPTPPATTPNGKIKFDKKEMKRLIGGIAFEIESLADTFPDTREVCDRILNLCRNAQEYTGV